MNPPAGRVPGDHDSGSAALPVMRSKASLHAAIRQHGRAALVVNTRSRRGRRLYPAVRARLQAAGLDLLGSFPSGRPGGLGAALTAAIGLRPDLLIVGGGDGTICEAARRLAHRDMALGLLPLAVRDLWLHTDPPLPLDIDGEIRGRTPVRIVLAPQALRIMVGTTFPDA